MGRGERDTVARGARLYEVAQAVIGDHGRAVEAVRAALKPIHDAAVKRELDAIPVIRLQDVTEGRLRLGSVEKSRLRTVGSVLEAGLYRLRQIPGAGQRTVDQMLAAARRLSEAVHETVAVHIDVDRPEPSTSALVMALHVPVEAGPDARRAVDKAAKLMLCHAPATDRHASAYPRTSGRRPSSLRQARAYLLGSIPRHRLRQLSGVRCGRPRAASGR